MVIFIEQECDLSLNFKILTFRFEFTIGFKVKKICPLGLNLPLGPLPLNLPLGLNFKNLTIRFEFTIGFKVKKYNL